MTSSGRRVSALVVTYNRKDLLTECLSAIKTQDLPVERTVIIDNASTDGTPALFADGGVFFGDSRIDYCRMETNLGGAGGFKEGIRKCVEFGCDFIWLMDDDCIAYPDTLRNLVAAYDISNDFGSAPSFLASTVYGAGGEAMNVPKVDMRPTSNGYADWYRLLASGMVEIECATFVSLLISASAVSKVGLPIADFFIWGDDTEYTTRLTHYYGPAYMVGNSCVLHKRANAKSLNIQNEIDPSRIANYHRMYRNNLIVQRYHHGKKQSIIRVFGYLYQAIVCTLSGTGGGAMRWARSRAIIKGVTEYLFKRYKLEDLQDLLAVSDDACK